MYKLTYTTITDQDRYMNMDTMKWKSLFGWQAVRRQCAIAKYPKKNSGCRCF